MVVDVQLFQSFNAACQQGAPWLDFQRILQYINSRKTAQCCPKMMFFYVGVRIYHRYCCACDFSVFGESCSQFCSRPQQKRKELTSKCYLKKNSCQGYILCTKLVCKIPVKVFQAAVAPVEKTWLPYGLLEKMQSFQGRFIPASRF